MRKLPKNLKEFLETCDKCQEIQEEVLIDILSFAKDTVFGKKHKFNKIENVKQFRENIHITEWNDIEPYIDRIINNEKDVLFPGLPPYFVCTSGTTGSIKKIPESDWGKKVKSLTTSIKVEAILKYAPEIKTSKILPLVNHAVEGYTKYNVPYGSASGISLATASDNIKKTVALPIEILDLGYEEDMDYLIMRFALEEDNVGIIFANNALRVAQVLSSAQKNFDKIINDIARGTVEGMEHFPEDIQNSLKEKLKPNPERAKFLRKIKESKKPIIPESYWPNFRVVSCWLSGSVGRYVEQAKPFFSDKVIFFDIGYGATEGKFNIPLEPSNPSGILTTYSAFFEFKPLDKNDFVMAHETKAGERYELFVTTYSGLYRYPMHDIVKVTGFEKTTPKIVFEQKSKDILNLCGEKVAAITLVPLVKNVIGEGLVHWNVFPDKKNSCYHFKIEHNNSMLDEKEVAEKLEKLLMDNTHIYSIFRTQGMLNPCKVSFMQKGWSQKLISQKIKNNQTTAQVKLPLVVDDIYE